MIFQNELIIGFVLLVSREVTFGFSLEFKIWGNCYFSGNVQFCCGTASGLNQSKTGEFSDCHTNSEKLAFPRNHFKHWLRYLFYMYKSEYLLGCCMKLRFQINLIRESLSSCLSVHGRIQVLAQANPNLLSYYAQDIANSELGKFGNWKPKPKPNTTNQPTTTKQNPNHKKNKTNKQHPPSPKKQNKTTHQKNPNYKSMAKLSSWSG